ncbi:MAG TPA: thioredoxin family protein [Spirochaetia bacterium]|nr:thioredoxin family protein [Spirochaetia bacterium]
MKRSILFAALLVALAGAATAQGMSGSSSGSGSDNGTMMAPADKGSADSMMAQPNSMSNGSMMEDMSYATLKKEGKLADTRMGMQLRMAKSTGMKVAYTNFMSAEKVAAKGPTVLFFAADWCPNCQADLKDINANGSKLGDITVVVVDYDKSSDLKKKYGITAQDTFVQIGPMGEKVAIWNGGGVDGIVAKVQKTM